MPERSGPVHQLRSADHLPDLRTHTATRWNIYNVNAQCRECNRMKDGNGENYRLGLIERYGLPVVEKLEQERHATVKLTDNDYRTLTRFFKQQTAKL